MRFLLIFLLLSLASTIQSQVLVVSFKDSKTNEPIPNVQCKIGLLSTEFGSIKDTLSGFSLQNGQISFALKSSKPGITNAKSNIDFQLDYSHPIYQSASKLYAFELKEDTTKLNLYLKAERIQEVRDIVVKSNKPDTVYASKTYSVSDFELGANGELFILTYEKNLMKDAQLHCIYKDTTLFLQEIPERAEALKRDFRGNVHVQTETNMYGLQQTDSTLQLGSIPKDYFYKYVASIVDTSLTRQFFSSYIDIYPAFEYGALDQLDSTYKAILHIQDDLMMELYRSEYKWVDIRTKLWAKNLENQTGIDAEIYVGANVFTKSLYYEPVYAPLFLSNDTLYIFDYPKDMLRVYTTDGRLLRSIPIFHHYHAKQSGFQKNLQQDRKTGKIYTIYEQEGHFHVGLIDLKTGVVVQKVKLAFRYVEKVRVYDNQIYFVYRPFESTQKKFLYKQKIPIRDN
jgi:hypothetical protein